MSEAGETNVFVVEGDLEGGGLLMVLRSLMGTRKSGLLAVQSEQDLVSMTFVDGEIVAVDAMNHSMEEVLSEILASRGLLSPQKFAANVEPELAAGRLPGDVLMEAGLVAEEDLLDAVREQVFTQACELLRWHRGSYSWSENAESPLQAGLVPLGVPELMIRAQEELGTESVFGVSALELDALYQAETDSVDVKVIGRDGDWASTEDSSVWITGLEERMLGRLSEATAAAEVMLEFGVGRHEFRYALHVLVEQGLVRLQAGTPDTGQGKVHDLLGSSGTVSEVLSVPEAEGSDLEPDGSGALSWDETDLPGDFDSVPVFADESETFEGTASTSSFDDPLGSYRDLLDEDASQTWASRIRPETISQYATSWLVWVLALGLLALVVMQLGLRAQRDGLMYPFFWQSRVADQMEVKRWSQTAEKIDRALRVYHASQGRYPDDLEALVEIHLLSPADLYDSRGRWLAYGLDPTGYRLRPAEGDVPLESLMRRGEADQDLFLSSRAVGSTDPQPGGIRLLP